MPDVKELRTQVADLVTQAKSLYAEIEGLGDKATADQRTKLDNLIADGKKKRGELESAEKDEARGQDIKGLDEWANESAGRKSQDPAPGDNAAGRQRKSWGQLVIESAEFKSNNGREMEGVEVPDMGIIPRKALYGSSDPAGGYLVVPDRSEELLDIARQRPVTILDLVDSQRTSSDSIEYLELNSRTNNAAVVPEYQNGNGGAKPESNLGFNLRTAAVKTIATWVGATRQILQDAPRMRDTVDGELRYMLRYEFERQVLVGDGLNSNFTGILNWSGIQARVMSGSSPVGRGQTTSDTKLDTIRRAITDIRLEFYEATGIVLNPADSEALELAKDGESRYMNIYDPVAQRVWRTPVVESQVISALTALVGNFRLGARIWDREQTQIFTGQPMDFMLRNMWAILAEMRAAFAVVRPLAFEKITLI